MKGNKGGITIATFFQMARDLANVDLKEMARERGKREEKSLQNCPTCPIVPLSQQEMVFLSKLLYINILSFLLHLFFVIWDNGTLGQVGQVVQFCKEFYSLFPLSLAISLRSTLTISLVIIAILFSRTGKELCRIQLVGDV